MTGKVFRATTTQIGGHYRVLIVPDGAASYGLQTPYESCDRDKVVGVADFLNNMTPEMQNIWLSQWATEGDTQCA